MPFASGQVYCFLCGHSWHAVRPENAVNLECPHCHEPTGRPRFLDLPDEEQDGDGEDLPSSWPVDD